MKEKAAAEVYKPHAQAIRTIRSFFDFTLFNLLLLIE
jgi:hypothetical protein